MRSTWFTRGARAVLALVAVAVVVGVTPAAAKPKPGVKRSGSNLFALTAAIMQVNHQYCPVINTGNVCTDPSGNGVIEGGFWPKGTPDSYIFNSGLQIAGTVAGNAGIPWANDTTGAFFMDPRGDQQDGAPLTLVYNSLDAGDQAGWPAPEGAVTDTAVYNAVLLGRNSVSQQDLWFRAWDGNPTKLGGRAHPMGILVETRGMAWNYPSGNEDIIYFVYTFTNITSSVQADYNNPTVVNHDPTYLANLAALGTQFQQLNQTKYGFAFPQHGYAFNNVFAAFFEDCDIGTDNIGQNYSTPVFPFNMGVCYEAPFNEPTWTAAGSFTPSIFTPPTFFVGPGFTSVKYLKSPTDNAGVPLGLTMFSNTLNSATGYPDPVGVKQMYRYLSGGSSPANGDNPCSFQGKQQELHYCYLAQVSQDTRFFESSGPFTLSPGQSKTIVVAYINAPAVNTPFLQTQVGGDFKPGFGATGDSIAKDSTKVRQIERVMGWATQKDNNSDGVIDEQEVTVVPRSLLDKANKAQAVFNAKFLLPFSPEAPEFFLIPGDNQVTVVWQKSRTEDPATGGDPYFSIASNPIAIDPITGLPGPNPLYDPNFRKFDVEGYRIYRGRTAGQLQLVAQFDYAGTEMVDYTGAFNWGNCAPELGVNFLTAGNTCPRGPDPDSVLFDSTAIAHGAGAPVSLVGNVLQVPAGGRVKLSDGSVFVTTADTAVTGGNSGFPGLTDTGILFTYVDRSVRNLFQYFYSVTAFDINSVSSGPTSLESARATKTVTPRAGSTTIAQATLSPVGVYGTDGTQLNPNAAFPAIDATNGTFSGTIPPANDGVMSIAAAAVEALPLGPVSLTIDSVMPGFAGGIGGPSNIFISVTAGGSTVQQIVPFLPQPQFSDSPNGGTTSYTDNVPAIPFDSGAAHRFGLKFTQDARMPVTWSGAVVPISYSSGGVSLTAGRYNSGGEGSRYLAHSRWSDEGGAEVANPTVTAYADSAHNAGKVTGVGRIWAPADYRDRVSDPSTNGDAAGPNGSTNLGNFRGYGFGQTTWYPADFKVTWNADSSVTVFDETHHVTLPVAKNGGTGYGFLNVRQITGAGLGAGDLADGTGSATVDTIGYHSIYAMPPDCFPDWWAISCIQLEGKAQFEPIDFSETNAKTAVSNGVAIVINGEVFFMELAAIPAAGTAWHLRAISGSEKATCTGVLPAGSTTGYGPIMASCSAYTFTPYTTRPSYAPGLTYKFSVLSKYSVDSTKSGDLSLVHTVPDPYYVTNALEITPNNKVLKFVNLPSRAIIRIYSVSGILVQVLTHNDQTGGGEQIWDLRNRSNQFVASGVYFYHVEGPDGQTKVGRFTVVQFAP